MHHRQSLRRETGSLCGGTSETGKFLNLLACLSCTNLGIGNIHWKNDTCFHTRLHSLFAMPVWHCKIQSQNVVHVAIPVDAQNDAQTMTEKRRSGRMQRSEAIALSLCSCLLLADHHHEQQFPNRDLGFPLALVVG